MKYMDNLGDELSGNDLTNEPIYVDGSTDEAQDESYMETDPIPSSSDVNSIHKTLTAKQIRKACRNSGKAYITSSGKHVPEKKVTPLIECRAKCNTRFTLEIQQAIFNVYWGLGSYDKRSDFLSSMITVCNKKNIRPRNFEAEKEKFRMKTYNYSLEHEGQMIPTCKGCFLKTLDESEGMVKTVALKKRCDPTGSALLDARDKNRDYNIIPARSTLPFYC